MASTDGKKEFLNYPDELMWSILKHLSPAELELHVAPTCSKLFTLAHDPLLWKEICFTNVITKKIYNPIVAEHLSIVLERSTFLHTLKLPKKLLPNANEIYSVVANNCPRMKIFHLPYFVVTREVLHELAFKCPLIESIEFGTNYFNNLEELFPLKNMTCFRVRYCGPTCTTHPREICNVLQCLVQNCKQLTDLHVEGFFAHEAILSEIANEYKDNLKALTLMFMHPRFLNLADLELQCTKLESLSISVVNFRSMNDIQDIKGMTSIKHLKLHCGSDENFNFRNSIHGNIALVNVESLKFSFFSFQHNYPLLGGDEDLVNIANTFPNLKRLSLQSFLSATNAGLANLFANCQQLEYLKLDLMGPCVTAECLNDLKISLPLLQVLKVQRCENLLECTL